MQQHKIQRYAGAEEGRLVQFRIRGMERLEAKSKTNGNSKTEAIKTNTGGKVTCLAEGGVSSFQLQTKTAAELRLELNPTGDDQCSQWLG